MCVGSKISNSGLGTVLIILKDENKDGIFTVKELIRWIETNKLVKLESEGRDADMDRVIENHAAESAQTSNNGIQENKNVENTSN